MRWLRQRGVERPAHMDPRCAGGVLRPHGGRRHRFGRLLLRRLAQASRAAARARNDADPAYSARNRTRRFRPAPGLPPCCAARNAMRWSTPCGIAAPSARARCCASWSRSFSPGRCGRGEAPLQERGSRLKVVRPASRGVQYAQDLDVFMAYPVWHYVRKAANDEFARPQHTPGTARCRVLRQQGFDLIDQLEDYARSGGGAINADIGGYAIQVLLSASCPAQPQAFFPTWLSAARDR